MMRGWFKFRRRLLLIITNSLYSLLTPIVSVLLSLLVVRLASVELWGSFVERMLVAQLAAHIIGWGNKLYLLRHFSRAPNQLTEAWQTSLQTRLLLLLPVALMLPWLGWSPGQTALLLGWSAALVWRQAYDVLVIYRRAFLFALLTEIAGIFFLIGSVIWLREGLTVTLLLQLHLLSNAGKAIAYALRFRADTLSSKRGRVDLAYLGAAFTFFLLGFSGMVQSRVDLYSVTYFLSDGEVARYQVFINLLIYLQALADFIVTPFLKSLYRLSYAAILRLAVRLLGMGLLLVPPALGMVYLVISRVYRLEMPALFYPVGFLYVIPIYLSLPIIHSLYKANQQSTILWVNVAAALLNLGLNLWWIPHFGLLGALLATTAVRWSTAAFYLWRGLALRQQQQRALATQGSWP